MTIQEAHQLEQPQQSSDEMHTDRSRSPTGDTDGQTTTVNLSAFTVVPQVTPAASAPPLAFKATEPVSLSAVKGKTNKTNKTPKTMASSVVKQDDQSALQSTQATSVNESASAINMIHSSTATEDSNLLKNKFEASKKNLKVMDMVALANANDLSEGGVQILIAFANMHRFNEKTDNTLRETIFCMQKVGKVIAMLSYFEIDEISDAQALVALVYEVRTDQVLEPIALDLHKYMTLAHDYLSQSKKQKSI